MKAELDGAREKNQQEHQSQEKIITELRKKIQRLEEESERKIGYMQKAESTETELQEKQCALEEAHARETSLNDETRQLRQQLKTIEVQLAEVCDILGFLIF